MMTAEHAERVEINLNTMLEEVNNMDMLMQQIIDDLREHHACAANPA